MHYTYYSCIQKKIYQIFTIQNNNYHIYIIMLLKSDLLQRPTLMAQK